VRTNPLGDKEFFEAVVVGRGLNLVVLGLLGRK